MIKYIALNASYALAMVILYLDVAVWRALI
jgi:hypothetical protein